MKTSTKVALILSVLMLLAGGSLIYMSLYRAGFDWDKLTINEAFETYDYTVPGKIQDVRIESKQVDVHVLRSTTSVCNVRSKSASRDCCSVETDDDMLIVKCSEDSSYPWYKRIWRQDNTELYVFLPEQEYETLTITAGSGDVYVSDALSFASADVKTGSGDQEFFAPVSESLTVTSSSGDITVKRNSCKKITAVNSSGLVFCSDCRCGEVSATTSSGTINVSKCKIESVSANTASGEIDFLQINVSGTLKATSSSGDILYMYSTAGEIELISKSGDVVGWVIEPMLYDVRSDSGDVVLPSSGGSHHCTIRTGSGDVSFVEREYTP